MSGAAPSIEFLWWEGCPSWERALDDLRQEMARVGLDAEQIELREMLTDADAEREEFVGSPTIRVAGHDIQDPGPDPVGLTCRVYRLRDGRVSALPDPADIHDALIAATSKED